MENISSQQYEQNIYNSDDLFDCAVLLQSAHLLS